VRLSKTGHKSPKEGEEIMLRSITIFVVLVMLIGSNVFAQADSFIYPVQSDEVTNIFDNIVNPHSVDGGWYVNNGFGEHWNDNFSGDSPGGTDFPYHPGMDYNRYDGEENSGNDVPVYSIADGEVIRVQDMGSLGWAILVRYDLPSMEDLSIYIIPGTVATAEIQNASSVVAMYLHLYDNALGLSSDDHRPPLPIITVTKGQLLGYISSSLAHLHFEIRAGSNDQTADPPANGHQVAGYYDSEQAITDFGNIDPEDFIADHVGASSSIVGQFADGTISQEIVQKYNDMANVGNLLGDPWDNGGSVYVHPVSDFQVQQDFSDQDNGFTMPWTTITYFNDPWNSSRVGRLLKEGFWATYMNSSEEEGGYGWISLGVPVTNELPPDGYGKVKQRFWRLGDNYANDAGDWERRYLEWDPASSTITPLDADGNPMTWAECIASIGGQVASVASPDSRAFSANEMVSKSGQMHGGRAVSTSRSFFQSSLGDMPRSQSDGIYHSDIKVADFDQPFSLIDQQGYSGFYAMVGGAVIPIDPFTMNGDMTIYVGGPPPGADIQFSHWTIYPNPGTVGEEIHVEGEIWNEGGSSITVSELRLDFLDPNGSEVYGYSLYDTEFESGGGWYIWLNLYPYISGNHTARFRGLIDGQWQTYAIETVYVQSNPNQPVAAFFATPTSGTLPLDVQFTDESTNNPNDWFWNFGDGNTSTSQHPSHTYTVTGNYTVSLTAMNSSGNDLDIKMNYITVNLPTPVANFSATPMFGDAPLTVQFTNESEGGSFSSEWIFGDGSTSIEQNPDHIYITAGTYTVSLIIGDGAEADTLVRNDYIIVEDVFSGVEGDSLIVFGLDDNHPNPFNPQTVISYSLPSEQQVSLIIYDVRGRPVATLVDGVVSAGTHTTIWNGSDHTGHTVSSGVYFYRLTTNNNSSTRKMLLMK